LALKILGAEMPKRNYFLNFARAIDNFYNVSRPLFQMASVAMAVLYKAYLMDF